MLSADPQRSCTLGRTKEEQLPFIDVVLGRKDADLQDIPVPLRHADIVILDQNIGLDRVDHLLGSEVAGQLQEAGFCGLVCISTASAVDQMGSIAGQPGVDLVLEKGREET
jgi:hypothetical protein